MSDAGHMGVVAITHRPLITTGKEQKGLASDPITTFWRTWDVDGKLHVVVMRRFAAQYNEGDLHEISASLGDEIIRQNNRGTAGVCEGEVEDFALVPLPTYLEVAYSFDPKTEAREVGFAWLDKTMISVTDSASGLHDDIRPVGGF